MLRPEVKMRLKSSISNGLICLFAVTMTSGLIGCSSKQSDPAQSPNVILIVMDAVRAGHLSCYGYERRTSPHIDGFASQATLYTKAIASAPWTIPSHASLFTGKDPFQHGAHRMKVNEYIKKNPLPPSHLTLTEMFDREGYVTAAIVANDGFLSPRWGFDRGFQTYEMSSANGDSVNHRIFHWLESVEGKPFFLFINYMDAHQPYNTTPRDGLLDVPLDPDEKLPSRLLKMALQGRDRYPERLVSRVIDQYDTAIANLDEHLSQLFNKLESLDVYDNSIIVLMSDHGEAFWDHQFVQHGNDVYQEEVWIPLIIKEPEQAEPGRNEEVISESDIARLILQFLPEGTEQRYMSEFPNSMGNHPVISENYYSLKQMQIDRSRFERIRTAVYDWPNKYIHSSKGESELYNLDDDPGETRNLIDDFPAVARRLEERLEAYKSARGQSEEIVEQPALTPEEIKKLKALGYVGN
jgi:arylsulfatase A-like enzyme